MRRKPTRWTEDMDEFLVKKRAEGMTYDRIALILGVPRIMASKRFRYLKPDVPATRVIRCKKHPIEIRNAVIVLRRKGYEFRYIAALVGLRFEQVRGIWNTWRYFEHNDYRRAA